jgi:hypothetical protein
MQTNREISRAKTERFVRCIEQDKAGTGACTKAFGGRYALGNAFDSHRITVENFRCDAREMPAPRPHVDDAIRASGERFDDSQQRFDLALLAQRHGTLFAESRLFVFLNSSGQTRDFEEISTKFDE